MVLSCLADDVECLNARDAYEALSLVDKHVDIDVVLVDLNMPDMDGIDLIRSLRARKLGIPIVLLSSTSDIQAIASAMQAGAIGFIPKAFNREQLKGAIWQVLDGDEFLPEDTRRAIEQLEQVDSDDHVNGGGLTERQLAVLELMARGYPNKKIATLLFISENTVKFHVRALLRAMGTDNRTQCVVTAEERGLLPRL